MMTIRITVILILLICLAGPNKALQDDMEGKDIFSLDDDKSDADMADDSMMADAGMADDSMMADAGMADGRMMADAGMADDSKMADAGMADGSMMADAGMADGRMMADADMADDSMMADAGMADGRMMADAGMADDSMMADERMMSECQFWNKVPVTKMIKLFTRNEEKCKEACAKRKGCLLWQVWKDRGCFLTALGYRTKRGLSFGLNCGLSSDNTASCDIKGNRAAIFKKRKVAGKVERLYCKNKCQETKLCLMWRYNMKTKKCVLGQYSEMFNANSSYGVKQCSSTPAPTTTTTTTSTTTTTTTTSTTTTTTTTSTTTTTTTTSTTTTTTSTTTTTTTTSTTTTTTTTSTTTTTTTTSTSTTTTTTCPTTTVILPECTDYIELNEATRSVNHEGTVDGIYISDVFGFDYGDCSETNQWNGPGWYRMTGEAGTKIPEQTPGRDRCGGSASGWLSGTHPTCQGVTKDVTFCFDFGSDCQWTTQGKISVCDGYVVYYLVDTLYCADRYCATN